MPEGQAISHSYPEIYALTLLGGFSFLISFFPFAEKRLDDLATLTAVITVCFFAYWACKSEFDAQLVYAILTASLFVPFLIQRKRNLIIYTLVTAVAFYLSIILVQKSDANLFVFFGIFILFGTLSYFLNHRRLIRQKYLESSQEQMQQSESMFNKLFSNSPVGISLIDQELKFKEVNQSFAEKFQTSSESLQMKSLSDFGLDDEGEAQRQQFLKIFNGELSRHSEERKFKRMDGTTIWMQTALSPIKNDKGEVLAALMVVEDVTHRKNYELDLEKYTRRLDYEEDENKQIYHVLSGAFKEPMQQTSALLAEIRTNHEIANDGEPAIELLEAEYKLSHIESMMEGLAYYSSIYPRVEESVILNAADPLKVACEALRDLIIDKEAQVEFETLPDVSYLENELTEIFFQLISNALKFSDPDSYPTVKINAIDSGRFYLFAVRDNGLGIAKSEQSEIFELFHKLARDRDTPGTGIGLSIAKKIVEQNGGRMSVQSNLSNGSVFTFTIRKHL